MKVYTNNEFIKKLKWLVRDVPNVYYSGKNWSKLNKNGKWQFDCVLSIKSILWGFCANKKLFRGGTVYKSNGVADFSCNGALNYCTNVSRDFTKLIPGEYLCMKGTKYNHSGIYLGNGKVFEDTTGWGKRKAIISDISTTGVRSLNGVKNLKWTYHGKLKYIDYEDFYDKKKELVKELQTNLNKEWNCGLEVDGKFGPKTTKACEKHQLKYGIKTKYMVKWLQKRLISFGYSVGNSKIDGKFGPNTLKAVKKFQKDYGLKVDGIVGKNTYRKLVYC